MCRPRFQPTFQRRQDHGTMQFKHFEMTTLTCILATKCPAYGTNEQCRKRGTSSRANPTPSPLLHVEDLFLAFPNFLFRNPVVCNAKMTMIIIRGSSHTPENSRYKGLVGTACLEDPSPGQNLENPPRTSWTGQDLPGHCSLAGSAVMVRWSGTCRAWSLVVLTIAKFRSGRLGASIIVGINQLRSSLECWSCSFNSPGLVSRRLRRHILLSAHDSGTCGL